MSPGAIFASVMTALMLIGIVRSTWKLLRAPGARRWRVLPCGLLALYGCGAFMGQGMAGAGALDFLPPSVEFPVWRPESVLRSSRDQTFVALAPASRIQVYDASGHFLRGWFVPSAGKPFRILPGAGGGIEVRGVGLTRFYDDHGRLVEANSVPARMEDLLLNPKPPLDVDWSAPWWPLASPFLAFAVGVVGILGMGGWQLPKNPKSARDRGSPPSRW